MIFLLALIFSSETIIENQLIIHNVREARDVAEKALAIEPHTPQLIKQAITAFARDGEEEKMLAIYPEWQGSDDERREIQEEMAWGIIQKGASSSKPLIRVMSALAAAMSQDAKGVLMLSRLLNDPNAAVRGISAQVSGEFLDEPLRQAVLKRIQEEREWMVRLPLIKALGTMKIESAKPYLEDLVSSGHITMEEKASAVEALVYLYEGSPRQELERLKNSDRAALRDLAARVVTFFQDKKDEDILISLIHDPRAEVRASAWQGLGLLKTPLNESGLNDNDFSVQLASAYHQLATKEAQAIEEWFEKVMRLGTKEEKRQAAGMTRISGQKGVELAKKFRHYSKDPFVLLNFSYAILDATALDVIYKECCHKGTLWMEEEAGLIPYLTESRVPHDPAIPNYPEVVDKDLRLQAINLLAIKEYPQAVNAAREFFKDPNWGITAMSLALILTEGDDNAVEIVKSLLNDPDPNVQLQAALILSKWDPEEKVLDLLERHYDRLPMEKKEIVITAIGEL
ncbi:MAG: HEAT repeat domain-containing protein, partial [Parachlamydiaceae bacterium]